MWIPALSAIGAGFAIGLAAIGSGVGQAIPGDVELLRSPGLLPSRGLNTTSKIPGFTPGGFSVSASCADKVITRSSNDNNSPTTIIRDGLVASQAVKLEPYKNAKL